MKKAIIVRGPAGVGKSSLAAALGLERHRLSSDELRLALGSPELGAEGSWSISQDPDRGAAMWNLFAKLAQERMERGETIVLDAMFWPVPDLRRYRDLALSLGYKVALADFTSVPVERTLVQDAGREQIRRVGKRAIERIYAQFATNQSEADKVDGMVRFKWSAEDDGAAMRSGLLSWVSEPARDLSAYEGVIHYGDLQGCLTVLAGPGGPLEKGLDPKSFHIFCGDLVDRGLENGKVVRWFKDNVVGRPNVALLWGNHEDHLSRFSKGQEPVSREFERRTLPDLLAQGVTPEMAGAVVGIAVDLFPYMWRGRQVVVNHAGLTGLPPLDEAGTPQWHLLSRRQLSKGAGSYSDPVDEAYARSVEALPPASRWTQVHGHRNKGVPALASAWSVNLEDGVEFGGNLRMARLDNAGWTAIERPNYVFATWRERFGRRSKSKIYEQGEHLMEGSMQADQDKARAGAEAFENEAPFTFDVRAPIPSWISDAGSAPPKLSTATIAAMEAHEGVLKKPMPDRPHISSLNFTREVFFDKKWDEVVVKARGLFYDTSTGEVASRGYDKFFNIGERPETEMSALSKSLVFPVVGYLKENGFLGNLGYDAARDELMCASKSTTGGDFAGWFKEIFEKGTTEEQRSEIKRYLRDAEASMVFEVIDPVRDPHMIKYPESKLVLLDIFHRSEDGLKLPYDQMAKAAKCFGLEPKRRMFEFKSMEQMAGWISKAHKDLTYRFAGQDIEGVVFEDKAGFQTKCKLPHYSFWKSMRTSKERVSRAFERRALVRAEVARNPKLAAPREQPLQKIDDSLRLTLNADAHPMARAFLAWCAEKTPAELAPDILTLRDRFEAEKGIASEWMQVRWDRFDPTEKEEPKIKKGAPKVGAELAASPEAVAEKAKGPRM